MSRSSDSRNDTDFLRFIAIALIINSHLDELYPIPFLGTGGAIGNSLFFMMSSFGLLLSYKKKARKFSEYYGRRIRRIYSIYWVELLIIVLPYKYIETFGIKNISHINDIPSLLYSFIYPFHHWFLHALMIYYILVFPILKNYRKSKIYFFISITSILYVYTYINHINLNIWCVEATYIRYFFYFMIFLFGVFIADENDKIRYSGFHDYLLLIICICIIYTHKFLMSKNILLSFQFIQQLFLFPIIFYLLKISRSYFVQKIVMRTPTSSTIIKFISKRTLEIYISHQYVIFIVLSMNIPFPINVLFVIVFTLIIASLINYISRRFMLPLLA